MFYSLGFDLASNLLDLEDDEFGWLQRGKANEDIDNSLIDIVLRGGLLIALDEVGFLRRAALEGALAIHLMHERSDVGAELSPERLVVRLEDSPLRAAVEALLEEEGEATHRQILPL